VRHVQIRHHVKPAQKDMEDQNPNNVNSVLKQANTYHQMEIALLVCQIVINVQIQNHVKLVLQVMEDSIQHVSNVLLMDFSSLMKLALLVRQDVQHVKIV